MSDFLDRHVRRIFPLPALLFVLVMMAFPLVYTVWVSLTGWSLSAGTPPDFLGLKNYLALLQDERFRLAVVRTFYFTFLAMVVEVVAGVAIALLLDRDYPGKRVVNAIMLLPMMATPVAIAMVWLFMYEPSAGIVNYVLRTLHGPTPLWIAGPNSAIPALVLVDIWEWTPMIILISLAGLSGLPAEVFEAARVDGASRGRTLWHVTLPMLMPTVTIAALLRLIDALKTFDIIYAMTGGGPGYASETLNIYTYQQAFSYFSFGFASAALVVFFAIVLGMSLLMTASRRVVEL
ncbi:MAG TPA: sugar ABC transporter permease [Candidatus Sulfotelmatobacter sp.]|nr:sugar ABC transporter permease [Candidatus Sulfotelmatobacter sp.]